MIRRLFIHLAHRSAGPDRTRPCPGLEVPGEGIPARTARRGEHASRLARYDSFQHLLQETLGIPVKLVPRGRLRRGDAGDRRRTAGPRRVQPLGVRRRWLDCKCVEPIVVPLEKDGTVFYIAVMITRKDSGITSLEQMRGHSLAWADPNSASGYLIPSASLKASWNRPKGRRVFLSHRIRWRP